MEYRDLLKSMSLREKISFLRGDDFWHTHAVLGRGIPPIMVSDGPNGLRKEEKNKETKERTIKTVCYPSAVALASSWDRDVMKQVGGLLADECIAKRVSVLLGPGINIKRSPLCGRNFEYYSEDPVLAGELAASYINGVQEKGVGTSLKHFAANGTETRRMLSDSVIDNRALREIYLRGFEIAVKKAQPWTIMCAYNKINGRYCTENSWLISDVLRGEWGFEGLTVSDWGAVNDRVSALNAGLDLEMPGTGYLNVRKIAKAYRNGEVSEETIDKSTGRVLDLVTKSLPHLSKPAEKISLDEHHKLAAKIAENCPILLKNDGILPIKQGQKVAIIGELAEKPIIQGFGSAQINTYKIDSLLDSLTGLGVDYKYAKGYTLGITTNPYIDKRNLNDALEVAKTSDVAIVFVGCNGLDVSEAADRKGLALPENQVSILKAVCEVTKNVAVVLASGSCVEMPWVDAPRAILQTYLLGEGYGEALANILTGKVSPSGKLPETYPISMEYTPCPNNYQTDKNDNVLYKESIFVGYRYYDKTGTPVLFPFGHGLSYTNFDYSALTLDKQEITPDDKVKLSFTVTNVGSYDGAEVAQVYVGLRESYVYRAPKELKEFAKVNLAAGDSQTVSVELDRHSFEYYSDRLDAFVVENGTYDIYVGSSSADIRLTGSIVVRSDEAVGEIDYMKSSPLYFAGDIKNVTDDDFAALMGLYEEDFVPHKTDDRFTRFNCLADAANTDCGKKIESFVSKAIGKALENDEVMYESVYNMVMTMPLCRLEAFTQGKVSEAGVDAIVHLINSNSITESLAVAASGIPDMLLNVIEPLVLKFVDKKSVK